MSAIHQRPIYGEPERNVFGHVIGTLGVNSFQQNRLLRRVLEDAMRSYAGRHEETFLAKLHRDLASMERKALRQRWPGWEVGALKAMGRERR